MVALSHLSRPLLAVPFPVIRQGQGRRHASAAQAHGSSPDARAPPGSCHQAGSSQVLVTTKRPDDSTVLLLEEKIKKTGILNSDKNPGYC